MNTPQGSLNFRGLALVESLLGGLLIALTLVALISPYYAWAWAPPVAVGLVFVLMRWPRFGFYVVIFLIPFGSYRALPGPLGPIRIHWVIGASLIAVVLFRVAIRPSLAHLMNSRLWFWLGLLFSISLISSLLSPYPQTAWSSLFLLVASYVYLALTMTLVTSEDFSKILPRVVVVSVTLSCVLSLIDRAGEQGTRSIGGSTDPNHMAFIVLFSVPFLTQQILSARNTAMRILTVLALVIHLSAFAATQSRSGGMVFLLVFVGLLYEHRDRLSPKRLGIVLAALALCVAAVVVRMPEGYRARIGEAFTRPSQSRAISRRFSYLVVSAKAFAENPVLGTGPGTFRDIYAKTRYARRYYRPGGGDTLRRFAHNTYVEILVGTGAPGLLCFLAALFCGIRNFTKAKALCLRQERFSAAHVVSAYRLSYLATLAFLFFYSDVYNKYLVLALGCSEISLRAAGALTPAATQTATE